MDEAIIDVLISMADRCFVMQLWAPSGPVAWSYRHQRLLVPGVWVANALYEDSEAFSKMIKCHAELMFTASWLGPSKSRSPQD